MTISCPRASCHDHSRFSTTMSAKVCLARRRTREAARPSRRPLHSTAPAFVSTASRSSSESPSGTSRHPSAVLGHDHRASAFDVADAFTELCLQLTNVDTAFLHSSASVCLHSRVCIYISGCVSRKNPFGPKVLPLSSRDGDSVILKPAISRWTAACSVGVGGFDALHCGVGARRALQRDRGLVSARPLGLLKRGHEPRKGQDGRHSAIWHRDCSGLKCLACAALCGATSLSPLRREAHIASRHVSLHTRSRSN